MKEKFSKKTPLGRRRTDFSEAPEIDADLEQAMIEKEPVTVVCSEKGWIRTMKGHLEDVSGLTYKDGDKGQFTFHAMTTDKVMLFSSSGKFFTLEVGKLPGGRGHGEPVRLMCDLDAADSIVSLFVHRAGHQAAAGLDRGRRLHRAGGRVRRQHPQGQAGAERQGAGRGLRLRAVPEDATHIATIGENRKMIIFKRAEVPEMARGKGVRLQKFKDGGLSDAQAFKLKDGLSWTDSSGRNFVRHRPEGMDRRTRPGRPAAAQGLPEAQQVRVNRVRRHAYPTA